eukprot:TRINITY_DN9608_c3_g1_i1.p1 TRINITY_DN9608_c3_g1~~TRINITY_DN9608_c3_g1_i1.p1  ORF type:complete len:202 (+),score=64.58 TRINITY_DN9608_c3_g1_i1:127-732(+)
MSTLSGPWLKRRIEKQDAEIYLEDQQMKKAIRKALGDKYQKKDKKKKKKKKRKRGEDMSSSEDESASSDPMYNPTIGGFWAHLGVNRYTPFHEETRDDVETERVALYQHEQRSKQRWIADYKNYRSGLGPQTSADLMRVVEPGAGWSSKDQAVQDQAREAAEKGLPKFVEVDPMPPPAKKAKSGKSGKSGKKRRGGSPAEC